MYLTPCTFILYNQGKGEVITLNEKAAKVRRPKQPRSVQTKEAILQAAMELFSEKGFHHTNTKEIAARAGVSTGSFYSYYIDKRAVFIETLSVYNNEFQQLLLRSLNEFGMSEFKAPEQMMTHFLDSMIAAHGVYTQFHQELAVMYHSDTEIQAIMNRQYQKGLEMTQTYLLQWNEELRTKDIEAASVLMFETLNRVVDVIVFSEYQPDFADRIKSELVQMVTGYLFK